jgi:hypothetical protein
LKAEHVEFETGHALPLSADGAPRRNIAFSVELTTRNWSESGLFSALGRFFVVVGGRHSVASRDPRAGPFRPLRLHQAWR